ncbi:MAG: substrate-binding domain-containing protein [Alphaproteobacteria bacterium]
MKDRTMKPSRRTFMKGTAATVGLGALSASPFAPAFGQAFPSRNINVYVPTREGGGADRNLRAFTGVWKKYLNVDFENAYYPGAAGVVGYEKYMGLAKPDCYDLIFGNMGPEVLNWVVKKPTFSLDDYFYFAQVDQDPGELFVSAESPLQTIDDIIAEGKKRPLNVGVSRLAHPATLGALAVARHTGAQFNVIPLSGGKNTLAGVATGEMDFGALPTGTVIKKGKSFRIVLLFVDKNPLPERMAGVPLANDHLGMNLPPLIAGARAFAIKREAVEKYPDRYQILTDTLKKVYTDPDYKEAVVKTKAPWEFIRYGSPEDCAKYVKAITEIGEQFKDLLTGTKS